MGLLIVSGQVLCYSCAVTHIIHDIIMHKRLILNLFFDPPTQPYRSISPFLYFLEIELCCRAVAQQNEHLSV